MDGRIPSIFYEIECVHCNKCGKTGKCTQLVTEIEAVFSGVIMIYLLSFYLLYTKIVLIVDGRLFLD